jgi:hypothetical protein
VRRVLLATMVPLALGLAIVGLARMILGLRDYRGSLAVVSEVIGVNATSLTGELSVTTTLVQGIRATTDNLASVDLFLSNYTRPNRSPLWLRIRDTESGELLRVSVAPPRSIADNRYHAFAFAPISDSAGRRLMIELSSPEAEPGSSVTAWIDDRDPYPRGRAHVEGVPKRTLDLVSRLRYQADTHGILDELVNRVSQYKPLFFKGLRLKALAILALAISLVAVAAVAGSILWPGRTSIPSGRKPSP